MPFSPQTIYHTEARINTMRLQAAAPDLLAALKKAIVGIGDERPWYNQAVAAIAKAEGSDD